MHVKKEETKKTDEQYHEKQHNKNTTLPLIMFNKIIKQTGQFNFDKMYFVSDETGIDVRFTCN